MSLWQMIKLSDWLTNLTVAVIALCAAGCLSQPPTDMSHHDTGQRELAQALNRLGDGQDALHKQNGETTRILSDRIDGVKFAVGGQQEAMQAAIRQAIALQDEPQTPFSPVRTGYTGAKIGVKTDGSCEPCPRIMHDIRLLASEQGFQAGWTEDCEWMFVETDLACPWIEYYRDGVMIDRIEGYPQSGAWKAKSGTRYQGDIERIASRHPLVQKRSSVPKAPPASADTSQESRLNYASYGGAFNGYAAPQTTYYYSDSVSYGCGGGGGYQSSYGSNGGGFQGYAAPMQTYYAAPVVRYSAPLSRSWGFNVGAGFSNSGIYAGFGGSRRYCDPVTGMCY